MAHETGVEEAPDIPSLERRLPLWLRGALAVTAILLVPWTLWLTFSLPTRHVTRHYDIAWVGFDIALAAAFAATAIAAFRTSHWLQAFATLTGTMLICDAWFDTVTAASHSERLVAAAEAACAELPLAALCGWIVVDTTRFHDAVTRWYLAADERELTAPQPNAE